HQGAPAVLLGEHRARRRPERAVVQKRDLGIEPPFVSGESLPAKRGGWRAERAGWGSLLHVRAFGGTDPTRRRACAIADAPRRRSSVAKHGGQRPPMDTLPFQGRDFLPNTRRKIVSTCFK